MSSAVHPRIERIARQFWEEANLQRSFPADIQQAVSLTKDVRVVMLPKLNMEQVRQWLTERDLPCQLDGFDRKLHGFLLAYQGLGFIFINGTDAEEERRFTLSHEIAHFMLDYERPRQEAVRVLGENILEVLDGFRLATPEERLHGLIAKISLEPFSHLLDVEVMSNFSRLRVWRVEERADQLALELLAPATQIIRELRRMNLPKRAATWLQVLPNLLFEKYGLPSGIAQSYALHLAECGAERATLAEEWGII